MELPDQMLLLEPLGCTYQDIVLRHGARNSAAVSRYLDCLDRGWLGQALIERYTYGQSPEAPAGMLQNFSVKDGKFVECWKPIQDEIKDDLRELLRGQLHQMIVVERNIYAKGMDNIDDPGRKLLGQLVEMIDEGLQGLPKICVTIKSFRGLAVAPPIELQRCNGLKDTIARLSEVILGNQVVEMNIKKSGRDFHITYQFGHAEDDSPALALVEELKEWC